MDARSRSSRKKWIVISAIVLVIVGLIAGSNSNQQTQLTSSSVPNPTSQSTGGISVPSSDQPSSNVPVTQTPTPQPNCVPASQAASAEGTTGCVEFTGYAYTSYSGQMYLDQYTHSPYGFSVWIPAGTPSGPSILNQYSGKLIDVTGYIQNYRGEPEIELTNVSQITAAQ